MVSGSLVVPNSFVFPYNDSFFSKSGWRCLVLRLPRIHSPVHKTIHLSPSLAGGVGLLGCLQFICFPLWEFICLSVWLVVSGSWAVPDSFVSPYNDSFVSQTGWWCPALWLSPIHLFRRLVVSGSPSPIHLSSPKRFICFPVWLVVSGSLAVSNSFVSAYGHSFVSQSGWWCQALRLSRIHLFPSLTSGVRIHLFVSP